MANKQTKYLYIGRENIKGKTFSYVYIYMKYVKVHTIDTWRQTHIFLWFVRCVDERKKNEIWIPCYFLVVCSRFFFWLFVLFLFSGIEVLNVRAVNFIILRFICLTGDKCSTFEYQKRFGRNWICFLLEIPEMTGIFTFFQRHINTDHLSLFLSTYRVSKHFRCMR